MIRCPDSPKFLGIFEYFYPALSSDAVSDRTSRVLTMSLSTKGQTTATFLAFIGDYVSSELIVTTLCNRLTGPVSTMSR